MKHTRIPFPPPSATPGGHLPAALTRRDFLFRAGSGFGGLALTALLAQDQALASATRPQPVLRSDHRPRTTDHRPASPLSPKPPHFAPKAKSVIFLFMVGGPSHVETF